MFKYQVYWKKKDNEGWRKCKSLSEALKQVVVVFFEGFWYIKIKRA